MTKLTSIYNFVPLNEKVYYPEWASQVSQDIPFSDGEDGVITVDFHNVSPLFIRNGSSDRNNSDKHSSHIMIGDKRLYFIPGTSIKGMLRSTMEIMSFGKMTQYTNRFFSKRELGGKLTSDGAAYVALMQGVRPAWLRMEKDKLYLTPCNDVWLRISDWELVKLYPSLGKGKSGWQKNKYIANDAGQWYPEYELNGKKYRIVCTGNINKKIKEYLFPIGRLEEAPVSERVSQAFMSVHEPSPDFDRVVDYLKSGKELAVFYLPGANAYDIKAIGLSAMLRYPYKQSVDDLVSTQQNPDCNKPDLVETIFGYATGSSAKSMRGRVQIGNAFALSPLADDQLLNEVKGVQGQPKASFYPFYVKQTNNPYKTYDNADGIAGRKLYRVHKGHTVTALPSENGNENAVSRFIPLPSGQSFRLRIVVHNLRKFEIGALLSAITLHKTSGVWHNIGLAKGFGYGKLQIDGISLSEGFSSSVEDYLSEFERIMSLFTFTVLPSKAMWSDTPQISALMSILGEHDDEDMRVMEINSKELGKEYVNAKRHFDKLQEKAITVNSLLSADDKENVKETSLAYSKQLETQALVELKNKWKQKNEDKYAEAEALSKQEKYDEAYNKYEVIIKELTLSGCDTTEEVQCQEKVKLLQEDLIARRQQQIADENKDKKMKKYKDGLAATLDKVYAEGSPKAGQYEIVAFERLYKEISNWKKLAKEKELTDVEKAAFASTFRRICSGKLSNKDIKDLANKEKSRNWRKAKEFLGDKFDDLLGDFYDNY